MLPNWFTLGMLLTCHLLMARLDHAAVMSFMKSAISEYCMQHISYRRRLQIVFAGISSVLNRNDTAELMLCCNHVQHILIEYAHIL